MVNSEKKAVVLQQSLWYYNKYLTKMAGSFSITENIIDRFIDGAQLSHSNQKTRWVAVASRGVCIVGETNEQIGVVTGYYNFGYYKSNYNVWISRLLLFTSSFVSQVVYLSLAFIFVVILQQTRTSDRKIVDKWPNPVYYNHSYNISDYAEWMLEKR